MAENGLSTPVSKRAEKTCANILVAILVSFLIVLSVIGLDTRDPVTAGHAYAVEAVR